MNVDVTDCKSVESRLAAMRGKLSGVRCNTEAGFNQFAERSARLAVDELPSQRLRYAMERVRASTRETGDLAIVANTSSPKKRTTTVA